MSNAIAPALTWFRGEFAGIFVAPEAVPLFHEDKMSVSAEQLHSSASLRVWQLRAACVTFPRRAKYPPTTERSPCCSWRSSASVFSRLKGRWAREKERERERERIANLIIFQWAWRWDNQSLDIPMKFFRDSYNQRVVLDLIGSKWIIEWKCSRNVLFVYLLINTFSAVLLERERNANVGFFPANEILKMNWKF